MNWIRSDIFSNNSTGICCFYITFASQNCHLNTQKRKKDHAVDGLWFTHLSLIYSLLLSLIGLNTEQVYISWLCETLSCLRGQTRETTTEEKKSKFFRRLCLNAFWLRSSICASVFRNLLSDVPFDLWPGRNVTQEGETEPEEDFNQNLCVWKEGRGSFNPTTHLFLTSSQSSAKCSDWQFWIIIKKKKEKRETT